MTIDRLTARTHSDLGNAERLSALHGADLRYVPQWGWLTWDGCRYKSDGGVGVMRFAKQTVRSLYEEAARGETEDERRATSKHALSSERAGNIDAMIRLAQTEHPIAATPEQFDADPFKLNVSNGTLDLRTGQLQPSRREDCNTKLAPVVFDPDATCPRFMTFLSEIMCDRAELVTFLQRYIGYGLTGDCREQILAMPFGGGANGKGALTRVIEAMLGDYFVQADYASFLESRSTGPKEDLAALKGARFVAASESADGRRLAEGLIKTLIGQDTISVRFLHRDRFTFRPQFKLWLPTNSKPTIKGTDLGIWRRIALVPFDRTFSAAEQDDQLEATLQAELPGILRWAVEGCLSWLEQGLAIPDTVSDATADYREEQDVFGEFLSEQCECDPESSEAAAALLERYNATAPKSEQLSGVKLASALRAKGFNRVKTARGMRWVGLRLLPMECRDAGFASISANSSHPRAREKNSKTPSNLANPALTGFENGMIA